MPFEQRMYTATHFPKQTIRGNAVVLAACLALSACAKKDAPALHESAAIVPEPAAAAPAPVPAPSPAPDAVPSVTEYGFGALRAGVTYAAANESLKGALKAAPGANLAECDYVKWEGGPAGMLVMVVANKIARIDITGSSTVPTSAGAKIGDTEAQIQSLYPGRVTVSPHAYTDGHYLTVKSANPADSLNLIIFETDQGKVTRYRAGVKPGVEYIEGCS